MSKVNIFALFILSVVLSEVTFFTTLGISGTNDYYNDVLIADNGDFVVAGKSNSYDTYYTIFVSRFSNIGQHKWTFAYGDEATNILSQVIKQTQDGGFLIVGQDGSTTPHDMVVLKILSDGTLDWASTVGDGVSFTSGTDVMEMSDGSIRVLGHTNGPGGGDFDQFVVSLTSEGEMSGGNDQFIVGSSGRENVKSFHLDATTDKILFIGRDTGSGGLDPGKFTMSTIPTDLSTISSFRELGIGTYDCTPGSSQPTSDGVIILGSAEDDSVKAAIIKLVWDNDILERDWGYLFGGSGEKRFTGSCTAPNGDVIGVGVGSGEGSGGSDVLVMRFSATGEVKWAKLYGTDQDETGGNCVVDEEDNGIVITGYVEVDEVSLGMLFKTDGDGNLCSSEDLVVVEWTGYSKTTLVDETSSAGRGYIFSGLDVNQPSWTTFQGEEVEERKCFHDAGEEDSGSWDNWKKKNLMYCFL